MTASDDNGDIHSVHEDNEALTPDFMLRIDKGGFTLTMALSPGVESPEPKVDHLTAWVNLEMPTTPSLRWHRAHNTQIPAKLARVSDVVALAEKVVVADCCFCNAPAIRVVPGLPKLVSKCERCHTLDVLDAIQEDLRLELAEVDREVWDIGSARVHRKAYTHCMISVKPHTRAELRNWYDKQPFDWLAPSMRFEFHDPLTRNRAADRDRCFEDASSNWPGAEHHIVTYDELLEITRYRLRSLKQLIAQHGGSLRDAARAKFMAESRCSQDDLDKILQAK